MSNASVGEQQEIDLSKLPAHVPRETAEILLQWCGRKNPVLKRVLFDLRTKSAWEMLCKTLNNDISAAYLVWAIVRASKNYSPVRGHRKTLSAKYAEISDQCTQLANHIESLMRVSEEAEQEFDDAFVDLRNLNSLLFESTPASERKFDGIDAKQWEDNWNAVRAWVCARPEDTPHKNWQQVAELLDKPVTYIDNDKSSLSKEDEDRLKSLMDHASGEQNDEPMDEPTDAVMNFLDRSWDFAPNLPDVLRQASKSICEHVQHKLGASHATEMVLQGRKSSPKRDYLRVLWGGLFSSHYNMEVVVLFESFKDRLNKIFADFGTVILNLGADDMVTTHDVRQSRDKVLPYLEEQYEQLPEGRIGFPYGAELEVIRRWKN